MISEVLSPILVIFLVGAGISVITSLMNKKALGTEKAREVKRRMEEIRERMLEAQKEGNKSKVNECLRELIRVNSEYMRFTFKPMIVSIILVLLVLPLLSRTYSGRAVASIPKTLPLVGGLELSWFWWYFISTLVVSIVVKKILGV